MKNQDAGTKRVLLLFGSPHKRGSTAQVVQMLRDKCPTDWQWDVWYGYDHAIQPCDDCRYCYAKAGCSKRDLDEVYALLEQADILVIASPVYNLSFTTPLKALLDRTQRYWAARFVRGERPPISRPKRVVLLTTAEQDAHGGDMLERQLKPTLTILNAVLTASVHCLRDMTPEDKQQAVDKAVWQLLQN